MTWAPTDQRVWNSVRWLYIGSGLLFLANVALGIVNIFTEGAIPRNQRLAHLHAATIGWVTLSVIATAVWLYTAGRPVSDGVANFVRWLVGIGLVAAAGYVAAFGLTFSGDAPIGMLPLFGSVMALVIISALVFTIAQATKQPVMTTPHLLLMGALMVGSLGGLMGVLRGLNLAIIGFDPYPAGAGVEPVGAHAAPMEMYLLLAFAGIVEFLVRPAEAVRWSKPGLTQMILAVFGGFIAAVALFAGLEAVIPLGLLSFLVAFVIYFVRVGWMPFRLNPVAPGGNAPLVLGALFLPVYVILFVYVVVRYFIPQETPPHWLEIVFVHVVFIGMATNLLLAVQSRYTSSTVALRRLLPAAVWTLNIGLLVFLAGEYMADRREGAIVMAIGAIFSLVVIWAQLGRDWQGPQGPERALGQPRADQPPESPTPPPEPPAVGPE